jgi:hypothetical protein
MHHQQAVCSVMCYVLWSWLFLFVLRKQRASAPCILRDARAHSRWIRCAVRDASTCPSITSHHASTHLRFAQPVLPVRGAQRRGTHLNQRLRVVGCPWPTKQALTSLQALCSFVKRQRRSGAVRVSILEEWFSSCSSEGLWQLLSRNLRLPILLWVAFRLLLCLLFLR